MRSLNIGGTERQVALLAKELKARGWTVDLFSIDGTGVLRNELEASGIAVLDGGVRTGAPALPRAAALLRCEYRLFRHVLATRPHVVHAFLPLPNLFAALAGRVARTRLVITSKRGLGTHQDRHPSLAWIDRAANAMSTVVTANSRAIAEDVERRDGYSASRIVVIPNGLDFDRFEDAARDSARDKTRRALALTDADTAIVSVANLIPYKGHAELVEALAALAVEQPRARLFLIGEDRGIGSGLMEQALNAGLHSRVHLVGKRSDVPALLAAMDIGVLASHEEGLSNALLEKLAAGLPVVATDAGGNAEALSGMPGCRLVRARDANDLARGIREVLTDPDANSGAGKRRSLVRERYSVAAMIDGYERLYGKGLLGGGAPSP